ncbi:MAG: hypothetical protein V7711_18075, partial [Pseudomonadales bacterium]
RRCSFLMAVPIEVIATPRMTDIAKIDFGANPDSGRSGFGALSKSPERLNATILHLRQTAEMSNFAVSLKHLGAEETA